MFDRSALSILGSDKTDREYVLGTSSYFVYKMDSDTSTSGAIGTISVDGTFSIGSYQYNRDSGFPQTDIPRCSLVKIEHSQDYIDALKSTGAFKDTLTVQSIIFLTVLAKTPRFMVAQIFRLLCSTHRRYIMQVRL